MKRKNIALLTALPESVHGQRIAAGIFQQCEKYGYNVCVFGSMTHLEFKNNKPYKNGETNIFNLPNFSQLDGVILDTSTLIGDRNGETVRRICERLKEAPEVPAVALDMPIEGLPMIRNRNEEILREMCRHVIEVHGKTKICILTGQKGNTVAESRLYVFLNEIGSRGLTVIPEHIIYGDFWYTSGDKLADDLMSGAVPMPEAVLCASDHMALGLIDKLTKNGVKIPDELIVMGFDSTEEGATNKVTLSSYETNDANAAADAVDYIRGIIDPEAEIIPYSADASTMFHPAMSCGCEPDYLHSAKSVKHALYHTYRNYTDADLWDHIDIGHLMESYVLESFTAAQTVEECMKQIHHNTYLLHPFLNFYLCLNENWLDTDQKVQEGFPEKMKITVADSRAGGASFYTEDQSIIFETSQMLPQLSEESGKPSVYYFSSIHFAEKPLGYAVLQRDIHDPVQLDLVYRNWLRFVNNALEMIRSKTRLQILSVRDEMTGAYNRRGMYAELEKMLDNAGEDSSLFVCVIDMDGLKYINDTFGHQEGDFGICLVSSVVSSITKDGEIYVRAGGDEFYLIGVGQYTYDDLNKRVDEFNDLMAKKADTYTKPYTVTASIGAAFHRADESLNFEDVVCEADEVMYKYKLKRKAGK